MIILVNKIKEVGWCIRYFNLFYQFKGHIYLNEKPFSPIRYNFSVILGFWGSQNFAILKNCFYILSHSKQMSWSHGFNAKIGLKNGQPWAKIFAKMFRNMAGRTKPQPHFVFSQITWPRVVRFSNRFLLWNCGIEAVVLSTIKGTTEFLKIRNFACEPQKLPQNPKFVGKLDLIGKKKGRHHNLKMG